ncbi:general secretion pathway protein GspD [Azoarcus sp. DD4]|uniref:secretin N-terminal domain-containing protein n=1 Tax=Azoarcus sp. DD4 TaxID=2027405 RepID=UPI00112EB095|nr:secretin N-terminal domain-containing protein [Azoarcus sp. DD4]QDF95505.1 general secretion pathway protein GspD [Azoarcus sp. DD4]
MTPPAENARTWVPLLLAVALSACATNSSLEQSRADFARGDRLTALLALEDAVKREPRNIELRSYYLRQRELVTAEQLALAEQARERGEYDLAEKRYHALRRVDPGDARVRAGLDAIAAEHRRQARLAEGEVALGRGDLDAAEHRARSVLAEAPANQRAQRLMHEVDERRLKAGPAVAPGGMLARTVSLQFRDAPLRAVFEALSTAVGLNFIFDSEVRTEAPVSVFVRDTPVEEVIRLITWTQQLQRRQLNANTVLIFPATPAKQREYLELVSRSFYLSHADAKQAQALLKQLVKTRDLFIDEKLNLLVVKDTPEAVRLAERLLASLDVAEPEVMLEVEVLEVSRNKLRDIGLQFPAEIGYGLLDGTDGGELAASNINLERGSALVPYVSNPAAVLRLRSEDDDTSLLANPRIRVKNRAEAKIHIGEKLPVFTTTSTANVGVAASVSYLDVGLKLDVQPSVTLDDEVAIKVGLEVSNIVREVTGPEGSLAYQLGTRSAATTLRLRNGETQVLAGLINDEERSSASRLPGLGDLPVVGRLFTAESKEGIKTEIVLLITPRIVRNVVAPVTSRDNLPSGTEAMVGASPFTLSPTADKSLTLHGSASGAAPRPAAGLLPPPEALPAPAAQVPADVAVTMIAPPSIQAGSLLDFRIELQGNGRHDGGTIEFDYDARQLEPVGFTASGEGRGALAVPAGRLPITLPLSFRARTDASGSARVAISGVSLEVGGQRQPLALTGSATVAITQ